MRLVPAVTGQSSVGVTTVCRSAAALHRRAGLPATSACVPVYQATALSCAPGPKAVKRTVMEQPPTSHWRNRTLLMRRSAHHPNNSPINVGIMAPASRIAAPMEKNDRISVLLAPPNPDLPDSNSNKPTIIAKKTGRMASNSDDQRAQRSKRRTKAARHTTTTP